MSRNYAIIPVREFRESKQRLNLILSREERAELTFALLRKVISELQNSKIERIILVASDEIEAQNSLSQFSKLEIIRESKHHGGVNSAMKDGISRIAASRESKVLLLPSDLPLITSIAIDRVIEMLDVYDLIINPSDRRDGTNLLGFNLSKVIELHYDDQSVSNHILEAEKRKLHFKLIEWEELTFDVDDRQDLENLKRQYKVTNFPDLLLAITK